MFFDFPLPGWVRKTAGLVIIKASRRKQHLKYLAFWSKHQWTWEKSWKVPTYCMLKYFAVLIIFMSIVSFSPRTQETDPLLPRGRRTPAFSQESSGQYAWSEATGQKGSWVWAEDSRSAEAGMEYYVHCQKTEPSRSLSALDLSVMTQRFQVVLSASKSKRGRKGRHSQLLDELSLPRHSLWWLRQLTWNCSNAAFSAFLGQKQWFFLTRLTSCTHSAL